MTNHCEVCRYNNVCAVAYTIDYEDCDGTCLNLNFKPDFEDINDYDNEGLYDLWDGFTKVEVFYRMCDDINLI